MGTPPFRRMIHIDDLVKNVRLTPADEHHKVGRRFWVGKLNLAVSVRLLSSSMIRRLSFLLPLLIAVSFTTNFLIDADCSSSGAEVGGCVLAASADLEGRATPGAGCVHCGFHSSSPDEIDIPVHLNHWPPQDPVFENTCSLSPPEQPPKLA